MLPPPPGLFSTTAVWLRLPCRPAAISRAITSLAPPGVNGTMMRIVLLGKPAAGAGGSCACAANGQDNKDTETAAAAPPRMATSSRRRDAGIAPRQCAIEHPPRLFRLRSGIAGHVSI